MPSISARDVISDDEVRNLLEVRTQEQYQFRRAFRDHDATGINSGKFTFPQAENNVRMGMDEVGEESDYPRTKLSYEGIEAEYTKDGFEILITDEAVDDAAFDVIMDVTEEMAIGADRRLDSLAYVVLENQQNSSTIGSSGTDLNYEAIVDAYVQLVDDEFVPNDFVTLASPDAFGDLAKDDNFTQATEPGEETIRGGVLGSPFGVPVHITNTGDLGNDEAHMVDSGRYGYESTRWNREVTSYREESKDADVYKIRHRKDFVAMKPDANVFIEGGVT